MRKHQIFILLLVGGITVYFLCQNRNLAHKESEVRSELAILQAVVKSSQRHGAASTLYHKRSSSRPPTIDPAKFTTAFKSILNIESVDEARISLVEFLDKHRAQIATAPLSKLKEICSLLENDFPLNAESPDTHLVVIVWGHILEQILKSDPAWAFANFDERMTDAGASVDDKLNNLKRWPFLDSGSMTPAYATALRKWLDAAEAEGSFEANNPNVAELRAGIAAAEGDLSLILQQFSQIPLRHQDEAAMRYMEGLKTFEARLRAIEELGSIMYTDAFSNFVRQLTNNEGFDAVRELIESASLTPENFDLAAASIASSKICPETKERAAWLLENLRVDDYYALEHFTSTWTEDNFTDAASWINSLPPGARRDAALKGFIPVAARVDEASALDWALTISDPESRSMMYQQVYLKWKKTDPEQADDYSAAHPLNAANK